MERTKLDTNGKRYLAVSLIFPLFLAPLLLGISGAWDSTRLWVFLIIHSVAGWLSMFLLWRVNPALLNHRGERKADSKPWDIHLVRLMNIFSALILPVIAGLDIRFGWTRSNLDSVFQFTGYVLYILALFFVNWAMLVNTHFETNVRIQKDRSHRVVDSGPYAWIRHPGYFGTFLFWLSLPMILGSIWALLPMLAADVVLIIRTAKEDTTLKQELTSYRAYADRVRYRLFHGIW